MGWKVSRLWGREWRAFRQELSIYAGHLRRLWLDVKARQWEDAGHSFTNILTEGFRFLGRSIEAFAYTLGHLALIAAIAAPPLLTVYFLLRSAALL